jgi:hypothetical protein
VSKKIIGATVGTPTSPRKIADELQPVLCTPQALTEAQKAQARANIGVDGTAAGEPVAYLYNGLKLPALPQWDKAAYPHAVITTNSSSFFGDKATLYVFGSYTYTRTSDGDYAIYATDCRKYICPMDAQLLNAVGDWSDFSTLEGAYIDAHPGGYTKWVNFDLLGEAGGIFMAATAPVPVYADGGSGLTVVDFGEAVLSPDEPVVFPDGVEAALNAAIEANEPFMLKVNANSDGLILPITTVATIAVMGADVIVASTFGPYGIVLGKVGGNWNFKFEKADPGEAAVQSVNGQTGEVQLSAADVGARPDDWMPTAEEVGALPSTYTPPNQTAEQVGADPKGTAASAVSQHNTADDSHNDIRLELKAINDRLTAFFDSDNQTLDELSEIVAYITSNKSLIDAITTSKVSVTDIINNLTTNVSNKPLSAAQGVVLKGLIDTLSGNLANYQPKGDYALRAELPAVPVKSVNGKTGDVSLGAADVKARPDSWMPTASEVGAVPSSQLPAAINTALAQAKESGQFDGDKGDPGVTPHIGANGNWYTGDTDTGVKAQGAAGDAGRGIKSIVRTSGTGAAGTTDTYTVTYTDNTTSTISVYNGKDGTPGKTPAKGTDYFTDADKAELVTQVIAALPDASEVSY